MAGRGREKAAGLGGGGLVPAAAKQKWNGRSRNRAYSSRTLDVFSIQRLNRRKMELTKFDTCVKMTKIGNEVLPWR